MTSKEKEKEQRRQWREKNRDKLRAYEKSRREKTVCDMNCFECPFPDCVNSKAPTKQERMMLDEVLGLNDPIYLKRKEIERIEHRRTYARERYQRLKAEAKEVK